MRPVLFVALDRDVGAYGFFLGLAFALGWIIALSFARRDGVVVERAMGCFAITAAFALAGARVLWLVANPGAAVDVVGTQGLQAYGGFLGGLLGAFVGARVMKVGVRAWANAAVPAVLVGLAITRVGCFLQGCCYGTRTSVFAPWLERHPSTLYESAGAVALLALILVVTRAPPGRARLPGEVPKRSRVAWFFGGYAVLRFALEFVRDDPDRGSLGPLSTSQWISLAVLAVLAARALSARRA